MQHTQVLTSLVHASLSQHEVYPQRQPDIWRTLHGCSSKCIDRKTLHEVKHIPPSTKEEVTHALKIIHDQDYALGVYYELFPAIHTLKFGVPKV
jgi:hypothetical protein